MHPRTFTLFTTTRSRIARGVALVVALVSTAGVTRAQEPWTEASAVEAATRRVELAPREEARLEVVRASIDEATAMPVPRLGLLVDRVFGDVNSGYLQLGAELEHTFDVSPWRRRLRASASAREEVVRAEGSRWRAELRAEVRTAFFAARRAEERLTVLDGWIERLRGGVAAIEARRASGDVATYEVLRIRRELELAIARRATERAQLDEARATLAEWIGDEERPLTGSLVPDAPTGATATTPELARLRALDVALDQEARAIASPFAREWTVAGAYRFNEVGSSRGHGFLVSLQVPLALWNPERGRAARLRAEQAEVRAELAFREATAGAALRAAEGRVRAVLDALARLEASASDESLSRLAEAAYASGEATLTELLDAVASEVELRLAQVELQWEARRASIELDRRRGLGGESE